MIDFLHEFSQLKELQGITHPSIELLREVIREFRDCELEHLDTAVEHNSQRAPAHAFLSSVVGMCHGVQGCY
jgi:ubiquinone biosynthesis monooxygenase Coq7